MSDDAPKSAYELAMERLRRKDAESGESEVALSDAQKAAIAEARQVYAARKAQVEIMHTAALAAAFDPEARARLDEEFRRDLARLESERDQKIDAARRQA
jgi:hypothetical protein